MKDFYRVTGPLLQRDIKLHRDSLRVTLQITKHYKVTKNIVINLVFEVEKLLLKNPFLIQIISLNATKLLIASLK